MRLAKRKVAVIGWRLPNSFQIISDKGLVYIGGGVVGLFPDMAGKNPCFVK